MSIIQHLEMASTFTTNHLDEKEEREISGNVEDLTEGKPDLTNLKSVPVTQQNMDYHTSVMNTVAVNTLKSKAEVMKSKFVDHMDAELAKLVEKIIADATRQPEALKHVPSFSTLKERREHLAKKEFYSRRSPLTDLFEIPHIQTIKYIFIAILIILLCSTIIIDLFDHGTIGVDIQVWTWAFGKLPSVMIFWIGMQTTTLFGIYIPLTFWANNRAKSNRFDLFDYACLTYYILYIMNFLFAPLYFVWAHDLPLASTAIIIAEQVRFIMKSHAFVREKASEITEKTAAGETDIRIEFSNYLYFQFVPTLVYRDKYPRNEQIRWNLVFVHFAQFLGGILYTNYIFLRFCMPIFREFNHKNVNLETFVKSILSCILPGALNMFVVFYAFLHAWMNAFAEMFRFADRLFYRDWWNSTTFSNYYRTWNIVIHDWLYTYVYCDLYKLFGAGCRHAAMLVTFLLSAVVHEYIFLVMLRMFYPVMFVLFAGFGVWMVFVTQSRSSRGWNVIMWLSIFLGQGVLMCLYSSEFYARRNCPPTREDIMDFIIPRSWSCLDHKDTARLVNRTVD